MAPKTPASCSIVLESKPSALDGICQQILTDLKAFSFSEDDVFGVHLAFEEAFLNAVKHGNKMDPTKTVKVEYTIDRGKVEIAITDEGEGFDPSAIPDPRVGDNLYRPDGRGLLLIGAYMDVMEYNDSGNRVFMAKYSPKPENN